MNSATNAAASSAHKQQQQQGGQNKDKQKPKGGRGGNSSGSTKLRGMDRDSPEVRISKTLSWLLRHGAQGEGLHMRPDGYVKVIDLVCCDSSDFSTGILNKTFVSYNTQN